MEEKGREGRGDRGEGMEEKGIEGRGWRRRG